MKKIVKIILRTIGILLALLVILFACLSWYVSSHKKELLLRATTEINKQLNGNVSIDDVSVSFFKTFPSLAIQLTNITIRDSLYAKHRQDFLSLQKSYVRVNPFKLLLGKISINKLSIDSGSLHLITDTSGYTNTYLFKPKNKTKSGNQGNLADLLKKIEIHHFSFIQEDAILDKLFDIYINSMNLGINATGDNLTTINVDQSLRINALAFKKAIGSYAANQLIEGKYAVTFKPSTSELSFDSIPLRISDHPFRLTGVFKLGKEQVFSLQIKTFDMSVDFGKSLLTQKTAKGIGLVPVMKPVDVEAVIDGSLSGGDPLVIAKWVTKDNQIKTPLMDFTNCSFSGLYTNEVVKGQPRLDPNSKVEVYNFRGSWHGLPMAADKVVIMNLITPTIEASFYSDFELKQLNEILLTDALSLTAGKGFLRLNYKGPVDHLTAQNTMLNGSLAIRNGTILMHGPGSSLNNCNASIRFINSDVLIDTLNCSISGNPINFSGAAKNVLALIGPSNGGISLKLQVSAPVLNIDKLSSVISRKFPTRKPQLSGSNKLKQTAQQIDNLLSSGDININVKAGTLVYHKFSARNLQAAVQINASTWVLEKASLMHGKGNMFVTAKVTERSGDRFGLDANIRMQEMDAQKVWYEFENFGIPALNYKNIKGIFSTDANVSLLLSKSGNFDLGSLNGNADFSFKNGELINFKPMQDVQKFVFKDRDFSNISFAEIKDKITFSKGEVNIERMEINSSVLSMFVEGVYSLSGKNTDIGLQIPLSNLKKRKADYTPENLGADRGGGMSVFLRARTGSDGTIKIAYDPFKRLRKKKSA